MLPDEQEEARFVAEQILELTGKGHADVEGPISLERCAVLGRNKFVFGPIINAFEERGIEFFKRLSAANVESGSEMMVQFELALRVLANPLDRLHVAMLAKKWKTGSSADEVYDGLELREMTGMDVLSKLRPTADGENADIIYRAIDSLQWSPFDCKLVPALNLIEDKSQKFDDEARNRVLQDIKEWRQHWNYFVRSEQGGSHSVGSFLSQVALGTTQQPNLDGVALLTVHSAKGMEFDVVFLIGMNQGTFPDYRARDGNSIAEEQRNVFVAVTRSRRLLYITYPQRKMMPWGEEKLQRASQFLKPILATLQGG